MKKILHAIVFGMILPALPMSGMEPSPPEPIVIIGGGVGSLTSAIYLSRAGLSPLVIEGPNPGGLLTQSHSVGNWPGEMEIDGLALTEKMQAQAKANGARFLSEEVVGVDFSDKPLKITTRALDGSGKTREITTESCIIAMGTKPNFLGIPGEQTYWGKGVTNCAVCDGALFPNKIVGVVGGGDAAVLEALYLANIAKEVHVFIRKDSLRAGEEKRVQILRSKPNVKFHYNTTVQSVNGNGKSVTGVALVKNGEAIDSFALDGLFLAIGSTPNSSLFKESLNLDEKGYIVLEKDQQTSKAGVYAIGDIVDPIYKQAISAAGDGAKAALQAQQYISDRANQIVIQEVPVTKEVALASNEVIDISSIQQFEAELQSSEVPVVIDFYATWCGPCKRVTPILENSAQLLGGRVKFLKINVDKFAELSSSYEIKAMPTLLLLDSAGAELDRKVGFDQIADLLNGLHREESLPLSS